MARLDMARAARRHGSHTKMVLLVLLVFVAVVGMLNLTPPGLHAELHARSAHAELRELTEGQKWVQEEMDLEAADGLTVGSLQGRRTGGGFEDVSDQRGTRTFEHTFDSPDGTDADTSASDEQLAAAAAQQQQRSADAAAADQVNTAAGEKYHVICSLGSGVYTEWQSRVSYFWYKQVKAQCEEQLGAACAMGGYTRLLHSGKPDAWVDEIPTVVVDPLPRHLDEIAAGYVVLERPYAFKQWVEKYLDTIPENYIWMGEPDHLFLRAPPLWATPERPAAFPFFYIEPVKMKRIIDRFNPKQVPVSQFDPIGNSPVQIHKRQFAGLADAWFRLSIAIKNDTEADKEFGWVQEMYAYSIAAATALDAPVRHALHVEMQLQPPWDASLKAENGKDAIQIHFTYGNDFDSKGAFTPGKVGAWHWDKRDWTEKYPPRNFPLPPPGCTNVAVQELVRRVNEAADHLPRWDEFAGKLQAPVAPNSRRRQLLGARPRPVPAAAGGEGGGGSGAARARHGLRLPDAL